MTNQNILQYESKVWATADLLRGAGVKESDFPKYMMPFFALVLVESRVLRSIEEVKADLPEGTSEEDIFEEINEKGIGYNRYIFDKKKTLKDICLNDKTFELDFNTYLKAYDDTTQTLLGIDKTANDVKYLDLTSIAGQLKNKKILFDFVKKWSEIDLAGFSNSEITTLEEHIKRKWADISADTAGEQYTPDDVIALMAELIAYLLEGDTTELLTLYDPTCGGGNLLFGVEDRLTQGFPNKFTETYGQDWSDALFALAKIESRFRKGSHISYGNTLVDDRYPELSAKIVVANPPYGVDWKGFQKDIEKDKTERFHYLPAISDGQLLFMQHLVSKMSDDGLGVVVHNGSTLFSGDAGSGESNIRKWLFDNDLVEAIIQLPTDEFFNTNIYTYLWVLNRNKKAERKDKLILINASDKFKLLKKSKGKKRKEMAEENRAEVVDALRNFKDSDFTKVYHKWNFYFNKQAIMLTNVDENGLSFESQLPTKTNKEGIEIRAKSLPLTPVRIEQTDDTGTITLTDFEIDTFDKTQFSSVSDYFESVIAPLVVQLDYKEKQAKIHTADAVYWYDAEQESIIKEQKGKQTALGCGKIIIKAAYKKPSKAKGEYYEISVELTPDYQKDYEIIPYSSDPVQNLENIESFMKKYVTKPFEYLDNVVGVEVNFNKVFYKPEALRDVAMIVKDLAVLEVELQTLEKELSL